MGDYFVLYYHDEAKTGADFVWNYKLSSCHYFEMFATYKKSADDFKNMYAKTWKISMKWSYDLWKQEEHDCHGPG